MEEKNIRESVNPEALKELYKKRYFERITMNSNSILHTLEQEPNQTLLKLVTPYIESNRAKLSIEDLDIYLKTVLYGEDQEILTTFSVGSDPNDFTVETVSVDTYESLKSQAVDPAVIREEIKSQLIDSAY